MEQANDPVKMHPQGGPDQVETTSRKPASCPGFRSPAAFAVNRRLVLTNRTAPMPHSLLLPLLTMIGAIVMAGSQHSFGVAAYVPSTPNSQHATTTTTGTSSIPQPLRKLRPCHDINSDDPLFVLGLTTQLEPSKDDIKRAYKYLVTFYHPDAIADFHTAQEKQEASTRFAKINAAYRAALAHVAELELQREAAAREEAQRLAELEKLSDNPFNWALRTASMNKDHVTAQSRFEYIAWKMGQPTPGAAVATAATADFTVSSGGGAGGSCGSPEAGSLPPRKVHIRRRANPMPDKTVDPFTWATAGSTGL